MHIKNKLSNRLKFKEKLLTILMAKNTEQNIVGYCSVHWISNLIIARVEGYISELFIDKNNRGAGIGSA